MSNCTASDLIETKKKKKNDSKYNNHSNLLYAGVLVAVNHNKRFHYSHFCVQPMFSKVSS